MASGPSQTAEVQRRAADGVVQRASAPVVRCEGVTKSYQLGERRVEALRGVDLEISGAGFFGIMGASGSGKSTLMHLIGALDTPDTGEVYVGGQGLRGMGERELTAFRQRKIGIVFQQFNLLPTLSARENVELPGVLAGEDDRNLAARSEELMRALGVLERAHHRPDALSGGEQQRVAIARSLLFSPPVLLADEPTGNLDSVSAERLWRLLGEVAQDNAMTVVMVTHEPAAAAHCGRVFVLRDGMVEGTIETEGLDAAGVATRYQSLVSAS
ncbi:MAG: ABC transporter ATP-binding protein [Phycisphaeraceae bacterium]|nr:ABC transporter ATP-binding protein [Phycisphaeraceae bacterium]